MPASVTIPNGETGVSFTNNTTSVIETTLCTITARLGSSTSTSELSISSPTLRFFTFNQYEAWGATENPFAYIELYDYAPEGGVTVNLESCNPEALSVPPTLHFAQVSISAGFYAYSSTVSTPMNVEIKATVNGQTMSRFIIVNPNRVRVFNASQLEAWGGSENPSLNIELDF